MLLVRATTRLVSRGAATLAALSICAVVVLALAGPGASPANAMPAREQDPGAVQDSQEQRKADRQEAEKAAQEGRKLPYYENGREVTITVLEKGPRARSKQVKAVVLEGRADPATGYIQVEVPSTGEVRSVEVGDIEESQDGTYRAGAPSKGDGYCSRADAANCAVKYQPSENTGSFFADTYRSTFSNCWMCTFVAAITMAADQFARIVYVQFAGAIAGLLTTIFSLWITLQATKLMFPSMAESPAKVVKNIFLVSLGFVMVWALIKTPVVMNMPSGGGYVAEAGGEATFFDWGPQLVVATGAGAAVELTERTRSAALQDMEQLARSAPDSIDGTASNNARICGGWDASRIEPIVAWGGSDPTQNTSAIHPDTLLDLTCLVHQVQITAGIGMTIAAAMLEGFGFLDYLQVGVLTTVIPAGILWATFGIAVVAFAFFILDAIVRVAFMSALAPVLLVMLLFPATRGMAGTGFQVIISGGASMIGLGMVFALSMIMISMTPLLVTDGSGNQVAGDLLELLSKIAGYDESAPQLSGDFNIFEGGFWYVFLCGILMNKMMARVGDLVKSVLNTYQSDPDSMGTGAQSLMGQGVKTIVLGSGAFLYSAASGADAAAAGATQNASGAAAGGAGAAKKSGVMSSYMKARGWMSQLGGRVDQELGE